MHNSYHAKSKWSFHLSAMLWALFHSAVSLYLKTHYDYLMRPCRALCTSLTEALIMKIASETKFCASLYYNTEELKIWEI